MKVTRLRVKAPLRVIASACCDLPDSMKSGFPTISSGPRRLWDLEEQLQRNTERALV
jgi:hypothetical protein